MARFSDIIGQDMIKEHLQGALSTGKTSHAYIIHGEKSIRDLLKHYELSLTNIPTLETFNQELSLLKK